MAVIGKDGVVGGIGELVLGGMSGGDTDLSRCGSRVSTGMAVWCGDESVLNASCGGLLVLAAACGGELSSPRCAEVLV